MTTSFLIYAFPISHSIPQITTLFRGDILIGYAGYFLLGHYLAQTDIPRRTRRIVYLLGLLGAFVTIGGNLFLSHLDGEPNDKFMGNLDLHVALMSATLFVGAKHNAFHLMPHIGKFLSYTGKDLFGIYLTHGVWLAVVNIPQVRNLCNHALSIPLISVFIFVLSLYTTKLIRLVPWLRKTVE